MKSIFSIFGGLIVVSMASAALAVGYGVGVEMATICISLSLFVYGKIVLSMTFMQGYGVKRVRTIFGMPIRLAIGVSIVSFFVAGFLYLAYEDSGLYPETVANLRCFSWSMASGVVTAIWHWYAVGRKAYWHGSEYDVRLMCKQKGYSRHRTEATVNEFRENGYLSQEA